ncbi:MAG: PAS domain S-box protein, partial [Thiotrichales bacterium]|nr:PAS domain S-box protein [Thiotrichales bacterium]
MMRPRAVLHITPGEIKEIITTRLFLVGLALALLVWVVNPLVDVYLVNNDSFTNQLFRPDTNELYKRAIISFLILKFTLLTSVFLQRARNDATALQDFESIVTCTTDMVALLDANRIYLTVNQTYCDMIKKTRNELIGNHPAKIFGEEFYNSTIKPNVDRCLAGERVNYLRAITFPDGDMRYMDITYFPRKDSSDNITGFIVYGRDITEKHKIEQQLARAQLTQDQARIGIFWATSEGRFTYVNDMACEWLQYNRDELLNMHVSDINPEFPMDAWPHHWQKIRQQGLVHVETVHQRKNGEIYPVEIYSNYVKIDDDEFKLSFVIDLSEREHIQKKLEHARLELKTIIDSEPECVKTMAEDGTVLSVNPAGLQQMEADGPGQVLGSSFYDLVAPEFRDDFIELNRRIFRGETVRQEFEIISLKGTRKRMETHAVPLRNENGEVMSHLAITRDVTQREAAKIALHDSEKRFRSYFELGLIGMAIMSPDKKWIEFNDTLHELFGYTRDEFSDLTWVELTHPDDLEKSVAPFNQVLNGEIDRYKIEKRYIHKNKSIIHAVISASAIRDPNGAVDYLVALVHDITDQKHAQLAIMESERQYRSVVEDTPVLICTFLENGELTYVNQSYCDYFGKPAAELIGSSFLSVIPEKERGPILDFIFTLTYESPTRTHENTVLFPDGSHRWQRWTNRAIFDNDRNIISYQSIGEDITERKQAELALIRRTEKLMANQKVLIRLAKEDFPDLETAMLTIARTDSEQLEVSRVGIWLYNEDKSAIHCEYLHNGEQDTTDSETVFTKKDYPRYFDTLESQGIVVAKDACTDPGTSEFADDYLVPLGISSMMDVPIFLRGKMVGIVCHEHTGPMRTWNVEDQDFATSIADMCALILASAERRQAKEELSYQAAHDSLTGLVNRFEFERCAENMLEIAKNEKVEHALCFLDLDQF